MSHPGNLCAHVNACLIPSKRREFNLIRCLTMRSVPRVTWLADPWASDATTICGQEMRALRALEREQAAARFVFMTERGAPMTPAGFRKMLARLGVARCVSPRQFLTWS